MVKIRSTAISKLFLFLLSAIAISGCQIASPLTTAENFLSALKEERLIYASSLLVVQERSANGGLRPLTEKERDDWINKAEERLEKIYSYSLANSLPLKNEVLASLGVEQGYEVYFSLDSQKAGQENLNAVIVKTDGSWKLLDPFP